MLRFFLAMLLGFGANFIFANQIREFSFESNLSDVSRFGKVAIVKESDGYTTDLYVNKKKIDVRADKDNFYVMQLNTRINLPEAVVYILWGGTGGTIDMDSNKQCKFLVLESGLDKISQLTYCKQYNLESQITIGDDATIRIKFKNIKAYAQSDDVGILSYNYRINLVKIIRPLKSDSYYRNKFAQLTPKAIYQEAQANYGVDTRTGLIDTSHVNMYGQRYCFKFNALQDPPHDKYYNLLKKSCDSTP